jgi:hypothetical protein
VANRARAGAGRGGAIRNSPQGYLSATRAAQIGGVNRNSLVRAYKAWRDGVKDAPRIRAREIHRPGLGQDGVGYLFDPHELAQDIAALPICKEAHCTNKAIGPSGGCSKHGHELAGPRARGVKRPDLGQKISAAKMGHRHPPEARAKMSRSKRRSEPKRRYCLWCGGKITRKRGLEDVAPSVLQRLELDLVPGWEIAGGGGKFCRISHHLLWDWRHDRERFHPGSGPSTFECSICLGPVERWPSQVKNAASRGNRFVCSGCIGHYRRAYAAAARVLDGTKPGTSISRRTRQAVEQVWAIGQDFESQIRQNAPGKTGRRRPIGVDFVIASFFRRGFSDAQIGQLLEKALAEGKTIPGLQGQTLAKGAQHVTQRRQRANIRRSPATI